LVICAIQWKGMIWKPSRYAAGRNRNGQNKAASMRAVMSPNASEAKDYFQQGMSAFNRRDKQEKRHILL
jgi:hypothetical protein